MRAPKVECFFGKERGVNTSEDDIRPALARHSSDLIATERISRMDADADGISPSYSGRIHTVQCLIYNHGISERPRGSCGEHIKPTRGNDRPTERDVARINQVNSHSNSL